MASAFGFPFPFLFQSTSNKSQPTQPETHTDDGIHPASHIHVVIRFSSRVLYRRSHGLGRGYGIIRRERILEAPSKSRRLQRAGLGTRNEDDTIDLTYTYTVPYSAPFNQTIHQNLVPEVVFSALRIPRGGVILGGYHCRHSYLIGGISGWCQRLNLRFSSIDNGSGRTTRPRPWRENVCI